MKKRKRQKNNRVLRKISHILLIAALFHYVPAFLRQSGMPYTETVYGWIVTYIYNGVPGIVLRPLCQWFWSLEWYPFIYFLTGAPSVLLFIAVRFQILLKGRIYETKKAEKTLSLVQERGRIQRRYHTAFAGRSKSVCGPVSCGATEIWCRRRNRWRCAGSSPETGNSVRIWRRSDCGISQNRCRSCMTGKPDR